LILLHAPSLPMPHLPHRHHPHYLVIRIPLSTLHPPNHCLLFNSIIILALMFRMLPCIFLLLLMRLLPLMS
jgi:hypothetical protein